MDLELSTPLAAVALLVLIAIVAGGTFTSGMPTSISMMVVPGLVVFGLLTFAVGVLHGQYRARNAGGT